MNNIDKLMGVVLDIATRAHINQKRWDGQPYINHPIKVREIAISNFDKFPNDDIDKLHVEIVSLWHDIAEDVDIKEVTLVDILAEEGFLVRKSDEYYRLLLELNIINKNRHANYRDYIIAAKNNIVTRQVKSADITHNMSNLKNGNMRDKYELALYILNH